jgi:hypothetical protein
MKVIFEFFFKARKSSRKSSLLTSDSKKQSDNESPTSSSKATPVRKLSKALARLLTFRRRNSESGKIHIFNQFLWHNYYKLVSYGKAMKNHEIQFESEEEPELDIRQTTSSALKTSNRANQRRHTGRQFY